MSTLAHFSLKQYEHMVNVGAFSDPSYKHLELIRGEIREMSPIGSAHAEFVNRLNEWSAKAVGDKPIRIRAQSPIRIPINDSEPEPDIVWAEASNYMHRHPEPQEVLLLIEVADTSLDTDRTEKLSIYAEASIADYWMVNLVDEQVEVYRQPSGKSYLSKTVHRNDAIHPLALPEAALVPSRLFAE
jgi:Uma2 family endonuclease